MDYPCGIHSIRCNQTRNCFTLATDNGVKIYQMDPLTVVGHLTKKDVGSCTVAEQFHNTYLVAIAGGGAFPKFGDNVVQVMDTKKRMLMSHATYKSRVLAIRFPPGYKFVAVLENKFYIHDFVTLKVQHTIETGHNPKGLCEVSSNGIMVFPAPSKGHVQVLDLNHLKPDSTISPVVINAHEGEIACLAISNSGSMIATASEKGTLLRIFNTATKKKELELRRGCDSAIVYSISFSPCDQFLSVCSDKGTVHVFAVRDPSLNKSNVLTQMGTLLPSNLSKPFEGQKSYAQFSIAEEYPSVLAYLDKQTIAAISLDGTMKKFLVTPQGHCKLKLSSYILDMGDDFD